MLLHMTYQALLIMANTIIDKGKYFYAVRLSAGAFNTLEAAVAGTNSFVTGLVTRLWILI